MEIKNPEKAKEAQGNEAGCPDCKSETSETVSDTERIILELKGLGVESGLMRKIIAKSEEVNQIRYEHLFKRLESMEGELELIGAKNHATRIVLGDMQAKQDAYNDVLIQVVMAYGMDEKALQALYSAMMDIYRAVVAGLEDNIDVFKGIKTPDEFKALIESHANAIKEACSEPIETKTQDIKKLNNLADFLKNRGRNFKHDEEVQ